MDVLRAKKRIPIILELYDNNQALSFPLFCILSLDISVDKWYVKPVS